MPVNGNPDPASRIPQRGMRVLSASGHALGQVAHTPTDTAFCVATEAGELWLMLDCIFTLEPNHITLICEREGMKRYAMPAPPDSATQAS